MSRTRLFLLLIVSISLSLPAKSTWAQIARINATVDSLDAESHLRFLTADEMRGRNTGTVELSIAGRYIAEQFRKYGLTPLGDEAGDYLQNVPLVNQVPATSATARLMEKTYTLGKDLILVAGSNMDIEGPVFYHPSLEEPLEGDLSGKVVVTILGNPQASLSVSLSDLQESGAAGLIQVYGPGQRFPWQLVMNYFGQGRISIDESSAEDGPALPHIWVNDTAQVLFKALSGGAEGPASLRIEGMRKDPVKAFNVVGKIEGTDPDLKSEHIVMCAHYDHVGVQAGEGQDSIYNGTRDNGIGTTGILNAARYFSAHPPKRSIIFLALTAEEKGLLGSSWYAEHPVIPLEETVLALNIDNSGYTGTEHLTLLDTNRVNIDPFVYQAAEEVGLKVMGDRIPSQNYFERSDQVSFARKGVPAINFKMAMETFDERIATYYHQPSDEFGSVDLQYIHKYWKAYIRSAELIANWEERPFWIEGDKFEPAGKALYGSF